MTVYRPPSLDKAAPIVDTKTGRITPYFQRFWQNLSFTAADGANQSSDISALQADVTSLEGTVTSLQGQVTSLGSSVTTISSSLSSLTTTVAGKVAKSTFTGFALPTGTLDRTTYAAYTSPTVSNPPTQAEVQAIADHLQIVSRHLAALITDIKT